MHKNDMASANAYWDTLNCPVCGCKFREGDHKIDGGRDDGRLIHPECAAVEGKG